MRFSFQKLILLLVGIMGIALTSYSLAAAQTQDPAEVGLFTAVEIAPDARFEIPISIRMVESLYAVDITLSFDPELIRVEDANSNLDGVQVALANFLDAGLFFYNQVDNDAGTIRFSMTQADPSEPKSGEGVLLVLYGQALQEGQSRIEVDSVALANLTGDEIPVAGVGAEIIVTSRAAAWQNTPIPVQDPAGFVQVPTQQPAPTSPLSRHTTPTPWASVDDLAGEDSVDGRDSEPGYRDAPADEPAPRISETNQLEHGLEEEASAQDEDSAAFSLLQYWWAVVTLAVIVIGLAIYLAATRK